jgi:hypothetical protein
MKRSTAWLAPLLAAIALGTSTALATPSASPYAGSWSGTYHNETFDSGGRLDFSIDDQGGLDGTFFNETYGVGGTLHGTVKDDGKFHVIGKSSLSSGQIYDGTLSIEDGHLLIDATRRGDGSKIIGDLTP